MRQRLSRVKQEFAEQPGFLGTQLGVPSTS